MKQQHLKVIGALTICGSLLVAVSSSFAAKSMNDKDMDGTTAAGQPRVDIGNGQQVIEDNSLYTVDIFGQATMVGDSIVNVAGENNIAVGVNVANVQDGGDVAQDNEITQNRNASVTGLVATWGDPSGVGSQPSNVSGWTGTSTDEGLAVGDINVLADSITADHIKVGHGDQREEDNSVYAVTIEAAAQNDVTALSLVNAAGRDNVAVALNAANRDAITIAAVNPTFAPGIVTQLNTITQGN